MIEAKIIKIINEAGAHNNVYEASIPGGTAKIYNCPELSIGQNITVEMSVDTTPGCMEMPWTFIKIND